MSESEMWVQGGREFTGAEIRQIQETVAWLPGLTRKELALTVCEHVHWYNASGTHQERACVRLLERLETAGPIALPAKRLKQVYQGPRLPKMAPLEHEHRPPLVARLHDLKPIALEPVTEAQAVARWNAAMARHHPLGYRGACGYRLRYRIRSGSVELGSVLVAGAARAIAVRDRWIGWSPRTRLRHLSRVINNTRFLIFPWVEVAHLASHVLGQLARRVMVDWQRQWGFSPVLMETFVDPRHYAGTCYRAAGWEVLGHTTGQGLARPGRHYRSSPRLILVKPLCRDWRTQLCDEPLPGSTAP